MIGTFVGLDHERIRNQVSESLYVRRMDDRRETRRLWQHRCVSSSDSIAPSPEHVYVNAAEATMI